MRERYAITVEPKTSEERVPAGWSRGNGDVWIWATVEAELGQRCDIVVEARCATTG